MRLGTRSRPNTEDTRGLTSRLEVSNKVTEERRSRERREEDRPSPEGKKKEVKRQNGKKKYGAHAEC